MPGQGVIVGVGSLDYPTEWKAADPVTLADLGVSKVITISSTYDHRIIQGAESGLFLKRVEELLLGADGFYDEVFRALGVPYEAVQWRRDVNPIDREQAMLEKQMAVANLIRVHRVRGHLIADLDPLRWKEPEMPVELDPATYGLTIWDLDREFLTGGLGGRDRMALGDILHVLRDAYCRTIGIEYMHIQDQEEQRWIQEQVEGVAPELDLDDQRYILERLNAAEAFEKFLATKYVGQKRFGLEGAEAAIPILDAILEAAADADLDGSVIGMPHRGRLNVLTNIVGKSYDQLFKEFEGQVDPDSMQGSGDVKYHLGQTGKFVARSGKDITVELAANPSHLEAVDPVVVGMARAKQDAINDPEAFSVLPILMHGDAAFAGQGVVAETLNMSDIKGYRVGGTIHVVVNNQIGFTTTAGVGALGLLLHRRRQDDPGADLPRERRRPRGVRARRPAGVRVPPAVPQGRRDRHGLLPPPRSQRGRRPQLHAAAHVRQDRAAPLGAQALHRVAREAGPALPRGGRGRARRLPAAAADRPRRDAAVGAHLRGARQGAAAARSGCCPTSRPAWTRTCSIAIYAALSTFPDTFQVHPKLLKQFEARDKLWADGEVDWALAEAMAYGSLLLEGTDIRMAGQDTRRGTFSHRHAVLVDHTNGDEYAPLAHLGRRAGQVLDLRLAAVGVRRPRVRVRLLGRRQGLARDLGGAVRRLLERRLHDRRPVPRVGRGQVEPDLGPGAVPAPRLRGPGSRAQLGPRRAVPRPVRRGQHPGGQLHAGVAGLPPPAPAGAPQRPQAAGRLHAEVAAAGQVHALTGRASCSQGSFRETIDDPEGRRPVGGRAAWCSPPARSATTPSPRATRLGAPVAVVRVEQLYPWPYDQLDEIVARYPNATEIVWLQEEPENMGAWSFVKGRLYERFGDSHEIHRVSRPESGSPACGSHTIHAQEQAMLLGAAMLVE